MSTIIKVEGLGKSYTINHEERERYTALRDVIARKTKKLFTRHSSSVTGHSSKEEFWALKDINFEVHQGDRIGIIGRNGAGKSTLLKILSRITEPTTGSIRIKGRVASLLEVGTGFHPELTGAENIYLNGAILGMSRAEVKKKFDEIVDFAEVEKFLDTPVKRYSSGMYVRLAFAVAAHLEPEILVVDEVLAVGDAEFQKKCLGKMEDVSKNEGRTVLFVSHNMAAIQVLCTRVLQLKDGILFSQSENVFNEIELYYSENRMNNNESNLPRRLCESFYFDKFDVLPEIVESGEPIDFILELHAKVPIKLISVVLLFYSSLGNRIAILDLRPFDKRTLNGVFVIKGGIKSLPFVEGNYTVGVYIESNLIRGDFLNITHIEVKARKSAMNYVPYPAKVRGLIELDLSYLEKNNG